MNLQICGLGRESVTFSWDTVATGKGFRDFVSHWQPRLREFDYAQRGAPVCGFLALACWYILAHAWGRNRP